ncbi:hypothetical protein [Larkinella arboricola]
MNIWKPKKDFPGKLTDGLSCFTVNNKVYVGLSTTGETEPYFNFGQEVYSKNFYEYDPVTDSWQTIESPPSYDFLAYTRFGDGATSFHYNQKGIVLWGLYRSGSQHYRFNFGGALYDAAKGWNPVSITIPDLPPLPQIHDEQMQKQLMTSRVVRQRGFGFAINNRIYTGGGDTRHSSIGEPFSGYEDVRKEVLSREFFEFNVTEKPDSLAMVVSKTLRTPSPDYNLMLARYAFALGQTGYIIMNNGQLVSFTPATNQWQKFDALSSPLVLGTDLNGKAYFINQAHQLLEYTPN